MSIKDKFKFNNAIVSNGRQQTCNQTSGIVILSTHTHTNSLQTEKHTKPIFISASSQTKVNHPSSFEALETN